MAVKQIFLNFSGLFSIGGKKYKNPIPAKDDKFISPNPNVWTMPSPKIGKILCGTNLFIFVKNKNIVKTNTIGRIKVLVFKVFVHLLP